MKRSAMIKILKDVFHEHMNCDYYCCADDDQIYDKILKTLEDFGMTPRYTSYKYGDIMNNYDVYMWQDEDDNEVSN